MPNLQPLGGKGKNAIAAEGKAVGIAPRFPRFGNHSLGFEFARRQIPGFQSSGGLGVGGGDNGFAVQTQQGRIEGGEGLVR